ncbi:MAG TPA: hypothetical protein VKU01_31700 [Bryobacteraceae bacterium]|nr:hypothetical protein [Bryobacteraceae bacterium]
MKLFWVLPVLISTIPALADKNEPQFSPGTASSYASKQTNEGVTIAVKAYDTEDLAHSAFGKLNPYDYGILPVLVIIQNDTDKSLRLDRVEVDYEGIDGNRIEATPAADVPYAVESPKRPASAPIPSPIPKRKHKNPFSGPEIQTRAFAARMLPPHESASGFFYFQVHHRPGSSIYLTSIKEAGSGRDLFYFEIPLKDQP